jgi:non-lysosomal glucosylceramidase
VQGHGATVLNERDQGGVAPGSIEFTGEVPFARAKFPNQGPVALSLEAFSPLVLDDDGRDAYRDSSLPAASFTLRARNSGSQALPIALAFFWANRIGNGGYPGVKLQDPRSNFCEVLALEGGARLRFGHRGNKIDRRLNGEILLGVYGRADLEITQATWSAAPGRKAAWEKLAQTGSFNPLEAAQEQPAPWSGAEAGGALCAKKSVAPGETLEVTFILSWHFPDRVACEHPDIIYRNAYARWFTDASEAGRYLHDHLGRLCERTLRWHHRLDNSNLPAWLQRKLKNDVFPLYSSSFYTADGRFSTNESPTDMQGCMGTIDQRAASSAIYHMCFPDLSRSELMLFSHQQVHAEHTERYGEHWDTLAGRFGKRIDRLGAIRHDVGWDHLEGGRLGQKYWANLHWPDLSSVYVLQVYSQYIWTGDPSFLDAIYPRVMSALDFQARLDQDGDGIADLWGPGCSTYDNNNFPYYGACSFIATLYLAALRAGMDLAQLRGDTATGQRLQAIFEKVLASTEEKLFSQELGYYKNWVDVNSAGWKDGERPHDPESTNCMVSQLAGEWFAGLYGFEGLLDPERVRSALGAIFRKNVRLVEGCPANEVSADDKWVSASWPYYVETYFAMNAIYHGMPDEGLRTLEQIAHTFEVVDGSPWDAPLDWVGPQNTERGWGRWYMTNPCSWYVLLALGGFNYDITRGRLMLTPNIPTALGRLEKLPIFMPRFWATLDASPGAIRLKVDQLIGAGVLPLKELTVRDGRVQLRLNGQPLHPHAERRQKDRLYLGLDARLLAGDELSVQFD